DLNRIFPGDPNGGTHEERLAHHLARELRGCTTLALHSTQSYADPFAVVDSLDAVAASLCPRLPVDIVVETDLFTDGRLIEHPHTLEVECGLQGSDAAATNATRLAWSFLAATGSLADSEADEHLLGSERDPVSVFRLLDRIPKPPAETYEVFAENFHRVEEGERFAAADGEPLVAEQAFYPVLLSPYGYQSQFGYAAESRGELG
ncbi:MAG: succinylglutamate desuccinylase, partial [Halobacteriota archaeon]